MKIVPEFELHSGPLNGNLEAHSIEEPHRMVEEISLLFDVFLDDTTGVIHGAEGDELLERFDGFFDADQLDCVAN